MWPIWPIFGHFLGPIHGHSSITVLPMGSFFLEMISLCFLIIIWIGVCNFLVKGPFLGNFKHSQSSGSLESASRVVRNVTFRLKCSFFSW